MSLFLGGAEEIKPEVPDAVEPAPNLCHMLEDRAVGLRRLRHRPPPQHRLLDTHEDKLVTQPLVEQVCVVIECGMFGLCDLI